VVSLGTTYGQRLRRVAEVTVGVAVGVLIADLLVLALGTGWWQLALVVALAERKSLRQAAADIAVSQPAATKLLHDLEAAFAVPLFTRETWGMAPTLYGDTVIRYARGMLNDLGEARAEVALLAAGAKGKLRVGAVTGAVPRLLAPAVTSVRREHPGLQLFVLVNASEVLVAALRDGTLDVAVGPRPAHGDLGDVRCESLAAEPLCLVTRADHPLARMAQVRMADVAGRTWILQPPESALRRVADGLLERARVRPAGLIETVSIVASLALLQSEDAVSLLPVDLARHYEERRLLARLPIRLPRGGSSYDLMTRATRALSPAALLFADHVRAIARAGRVRGRR
jgi:DNA-binding transcriptional LysR family regulator